MKILVTGVGGPTPRSFAIALKKYGQLPDVEFIGTDINPLSIGLYQKNLFKYGYVIPPAHDEKGYWRSIEKIIEVHKIDMAVVLPEQEVLAWSKRKEERGLPCEALIPDMSIAKLLVNKSKMTQALQGMDVVPKSVSFQRNEVNYDTIFDKLGGMFWIRSSSGTSGLGSLKVESRKSLKNWIDIHPSVEHFIASEYLPGRNLACKLLYYKGFLIRSASAERVSYIMAKVAPSGITGNTSFGRLVNEPKLVEKSVGAMDKLFEFSRAQKHGFFTVDFKEDETGKPYITEINVRHVAFTQCFAAGGANFAEDTIRLLSNDSSLDITYKMYEFEKGLIFLRDVDELPIMMSESDLLIGL